MDRYSRVAPSRPVFLSGASHRHHMQAAAGRRSGAAAEMEELAIFTAERYFNAADAIKYSAAAVHAADAPQLAVDAPTNQTAASSEASWNSRSGLLASNQSSSLAAARQHEKIGYGDANTIDLGLGIVVQVTRDDRRHRGGGKKPGQRWGLFSRDCPCAGRKAVTVDVASEPPSPTTPSVHHARLNALGLEDRAIFKANGLPPPSANDEPGVMKIMSTTGSRAFPLRANSDSLLAPAPPSKGGGTAPPFPAFPPDVDRRVVSSGSGFTFPVIAPAVVDEPPRESLEVFRPIDEDSVVLVDPPPDRGAAGFLRAPAVVADDEDAMSDASSDLFDLESFAASSSYPTTYRGRSSRRNSREDDDHLAYSAAAVAEPALSECMYAPSEASVVWSVATAEGVAYDVAGSVANFSSAASACCVDDIRFVPPPESAAGHDGFTAAMSRSAGRKKGFLNSCRCEKAVSVGPTPVRVARPPAGPAKTASRAMGLEGGGAARYHNRRVHMPVRT